MKMKSNVQLVAGEALHIVAKQYPRVPLVLIEAVQNGIDVNATTVQVVINKKKRMAAVRDNGDGVTLGGFEMALKNVCLSIKTPNKYGQFGIGLIAGLGKCEKFFFTTLVREKGGKTAVRWTFDSKEIKTMRDVSVPYEIVTSDVLHDEKVPSHGVAKWTSELRFTKLTSDKQIGRIDVAELRQEILESFAVKMRKNKVTVWIDEIDENGIMHESVQIRASDFAGKPLTELKERDANGTTNIRIFVIPRNTKRKGEVLVGVLDNPFRVSFSNFAKQVGALNFLNPNVIDAFKSGIFEGELLQSNIKLEPNRKTFTENDALLNFCIRLEDWYQTHGREYIENAKDSRAEERLQDLGRRSLEHLKPFFDLFPEFAGVLRSGKLGRVTDNHTTPAHRAVAGTEDTTTINAIRGGVLKPNGSGSHANDKPKEAREGHIPYTVTGPKGTRRTMVKGDSPGPQLLSCRNGGEQQALGTRLIGRDALLQHPPS